MMYKIPHKLTRKLMKNKFDSIVYQRGMFYYIQHRVKDLYYDEDKETWVGNVAGTYTYEVRVEFADSDIKTNCGCPANGTYGQCKHEVAVLLELIDMKEEEDNTSVLQSPLKVDDKNERERNDSLKYDIARTNRLIELFSQQQMDVYTDASTEKEPLVVEYILKTIPSNAEYNYLTIELKIGLERTYVVKKLPQLLESREGNESVYFTSHFSYEPEEQYFIEEDIEVLEILQEMIKNERVYFNNQYMDYQQSSYESRELAIQPTIAKALLNKLKHRDTTLIINGESYTEFDVAEGDQLPFSFTLDSGDSDSFVLDLEELKDARLFADYGLLFNKGVFYPLSGAQQRVVKEILKIIKNDNKAKLTITQGQIGPLLTHVEPLLKKVGTISIDKSISDHVIAPPLQAKMHMDYQTPELKIKLEYHYGDRLVNPFQPTSAQANSGVILIRDIEKEQEIMSVIESAPLKFNGRELYLINEQALYDFLYHTIPLLEDKVDIFMTDSAKLLMVSEQYEPSASLDLDSSGNWLEFRFNIEGIASEDVQNILKSVIERKRYYRLPNGAFVPIDDEEFAPFYKLFDELDITKTELKHGEIRRPIYKGLQLADAMDSKNPAIQLGKALKRFIRDFSHPDQMDFDLPKSINAKLRDYQNFGFQWMKTLGHYHLGGILADDMGLGKTLQAIAFITSEIEEHKKTLPILVITPASVVYNWRNEFAKFSPKLTVQIIDGVPEDRKKRIEQAEKVDVLITSYPMLRQDIEHYQEKRFAAMFLDEAQAIKNPTTKIFKAVQEVIADQRFALSGTPIENRIDELWAIFQVILPGFFSSKVAFKSLPHEKISRMVRPFILRRMKRDVLKELPDKIETVQINELSQQQKELYLGYLEKIQMETMASIRDEGFNKSRIKILAGLTRLRQICNHPSLFVENYEGGSSKLEQLVELVETSIANGNRLLIFSQFASMLRMIRERLEQEGYQTFYLDGQTPSSERVEMAERFNHGEKEMFLVSLKAGGTGLNLTGADTVVLFDLWWNPAVEEQAAGRAHRIGQKKVVQVIRLITHGTIEEKIFELQQKKKELIENVIQSGDQMLTALSEQEIMEILNMNDV